MTMLGKVFANAGVQVYGPEPDGVPKEPPMMAGSHQRLVTMNEMLREPSTLPSAMMEASAEPSPQIGVRLFFLLEESSF